MRTRLPSEEKSYMVGTSLLRKTKLSRLSASTLLRRKGSAHIFFNRRLVTPHRLINKLFKIRNHINQKKENLTISLEKQEKLSDHNLIQNIINDEKEDKSAFRSWSGRKFKEYSSRYFKSKRQYNCQKNNEKVNKTVGTRIEYMLEESETVTVFFTGLTTEKEPENSKITINKNIDSNFHSEKDRVLAGKTGTQTLYIYNKLKLVQTDYIKTIDQASSVSSYELYKTYKQLENGNSSTSISTPHTRVRLVCWKPTNPTITVYEEYKDRLSEMKELFEARVDAITSKINVHDKIQFTDDYIQEAYKANIRGRVLDSEKIYKELVAFYAQKPTSQQGIPFASSSNKYSSRRTSRIQNSSSGSTMSQNFKPNTTSKKLTTDLNGSRQNTNLRRISQRRQSRKISNGLNISQLIKKDQDSTTIKIHGFEDVNNPRYSAGIGAQLDPMTLGKVKPSKMLLNESDDDVDNLIKPKYPHKFIAQLRLLESVVLFNVSRIEHQGDMANPQWNSLLRSWQTTDTEHRQKNSIMIESDYQCTEQKEIRQQSITTAPSTHNMIESTNSSAFHFQLRFKEVGLENQTISDLQLLDDQTYLVGLNDIKNNQHRLSVWCYDNYLKPVQSFLHSVSSTCIRTSMSRPPLAAVGFNEGAVKVYDLAHTKGKDSVFESTRQQEDTEPITGLVWLDEEETLNDSNSTKVFESKTSQNLRSRRSFLSICRSGTVRRWTLLKTMKCMWVWQLKVLDPTTSSISQSALVASSSDVLQGVHKKHSAYIVTASFGEKRKQLLMNKNDDIGVYGSNLGINSSQQNVRVTGLGCINNNTMNVFILDSGYACFTQSSDRGLAGIHESAKVLAMHTSRINAISVNPFMSSVFLTCAADSLVKLWNMDSWSMEKTNDHGQQSDVQNSQPVNNHDRDEESGHYQIMSEKTDLHAGTFQASDEINDILSVAWHPKLSTCFALSTGGGLCELWDLSIQTHAAIASFQFYEGASESGKAAVTSCDNGGDRVIYTHLHFASEKPLLVAGTLKGEIDIIYVAEDVCRTISTDLKKEKLLLHDFINS